MARPLREGTFPEVPSFRVPNSQPAVNLSAIPVQRHKEITLLFLKHANLRNGDADDAAATSLARDIESLGPVFIHAARLFSMRGDLIPASILDQFEAMEPQGWIAEFDLPEQPETIEQLVEDELGKKISRGFASFDINPTGFSGSGQIHDATLHDGRKVRVRIQRPAIRQRIVKDLDCLAEIAAFIDHPSGRGQMNSFSRTIERLRLTLMRELDYRREAAAMTELESKLEGYNRLKVLTVVHEFSSSRILTTEAAEGSELWEIPSPKDYATARDLAGQFLSGYLDQLLIIGQIHPEPHLENLRMTTDGRLIITEAAGTMSMSVAARTLLRYLLSGICERNLDVTADAAIRIGHLKERRNAMDRAAFVEKAGNAFHRPDIPGILHAVAREASLAGFPFPSDLHRVTDFLHHITKVSNTLCPGLNVETFIRDYLREKMRESDAHTVRFPSPSAA